jgi:hypothetical protein
VIISLNVINQLIFVMLKCNVIFNVRTDFLTIIKTSVGFKEFFYRKITALSRGRTEISKRILRKERKPDPELLVPANIRHVLPKYQGLDVNGITLPVSTV